jgi:hypothetical protein
MDDEDEEKVKRVQDAEAVEGHALAVKLVETGVLP